ncbi:MAG: hypothetical protein Q8936_12375 [Bacillota bacterium]|nr:hypothetical protein [Bacillota bacterium]
MKKIISGFLCMLLIFAVYNVRVSAATNLIQNGSFEDVTGNNPNGWTISVWDKKSNGSVLKVETGTGHTGSKFVTITNNINNDARYTQKVNVEENKMYKLSGYIKTNNISKQGSGACLSIEGKLEATTALTGTSADWQLKEMYIKTGKGINNITVTVDVGGYGSLSTGTASFDDITLEEVSSIPQNAIVSNIENAANNNSGAANNASANSSNSSSSAVRIIFGVIILIAIVGFGYYAYTNKNKKGSSQKIEEHSDEEENKGDDDLI